MVIRAGDIGAGKGEVFVLDMGEPVKIVDLAHNMIRLAGYEPEDGHRGRVHPAAARREAARGALRRRPRSCSRRRRGGSTARSARCRSTRPGWRRRWPRWKHLVMAGDEADLAERVVELIASPGGDAAAVVLRRVASRSHFGPGYRTNRRLRRPGRVPRPGRASRCSRLPMGATSAACASGPARRPSATPSARRRPRRSPPSGRRSCASWRSPAPPSTRRSASARNGASAARPGCRNRPAASASARAPPSFGARLAEPRCLVAIFVVLAARRRRRRLRAAQRLRRQRQRQEGGKQAAAKVAAERNRRHRPQRHRHRRPRRHLRRQSRGQGLQARRRHQHRPELRQPASSCSNAATRRKRARSPSSWGSRRSN